MVKDNLLVFPEKKVVKRTGKSLLLLIIASGLLYALSSLHFVLFHTVAELMTVVIGGTVFVLTLNLKNYIRNNPVKFLGIAYLFIGIIDLFHIMGYRGMGIFSESREANLATQFWISARYLEAFSFSCAFWFVHRRLHLTRTVMGFAGITAALLLSILLWDVFPDCWIPGRGLTSFKVISEWVVCAVLGASALLLYRNRAHFDGESLRFLWLAIGCTIAAEITFTLYAGVYDIVTFTGHIFKLLSFYFIYKVIIEKGLNNPFRIFFATLKRSEERFRRVVNHYPFVCAVYDRSRRFKFLNKTGLIIGEHTPEDILGKRDEDINPPEVTDHYLPMLKKVYETGEAQSGECLIKVPSGERTFEITYIPFMNKSKKIDEVMGITYDITARKKTEKILARREQEFSTLAEHIPYPVLRVDKYMRFLYVNPAWDRDFDINRQVVLGKTPAEIGFSGPEVDAWVHAVTGVFKKQASVESEITFHTRRGRKIYSSRMTPEFADTDSGGVESVLIVMTDVTKQKEYLQKQEESRKKLEVDYRRKDSALEKASVLLKEQSEAIVETTQELSRKEMALESVYTIATCSHQSMQDLCNRIVQEISRIFEVPCVVLRLSRDGVQMNARVVDFNLDVHFKDVFKHECRPCSIPVEQAESYQFAGDLKERFAACALVQDHLLKAYAGVPVYGKNKTPVGAISMFDSEYRAFSQDDLQVVEIFSEYVSYEAVRQKLEDELRQAQKMKLLGQLTAGLAHEVRNPLNSIMNLSETLHKKIRKDLGEENNFDKYFEFMQKRVRHMSRLVNELLEFGKPADKSNFRSQPLWAICRGAMQLWKKNNSREVIVDFKGCSREHRVNCNSGQLQQAIINLLDNAAAHSPAEAPIKVKGVDGTNDMVILQIIDQGEGVGVQEVEKVFEPFFTTRDDGTGLGLSIVENIIATHKGIIQISNNSDGPGCTVEIRLPVTREEKNYE